MPAIVFQHFHVSDLRGIQTLATEATLGVADLVEAMHHRILRLPRVVRLPSDERTPGITGFVYGAVRGVTRLVGTSAGSVLDSVEKRFDAKASTPEREAALAVLNGVLGDRLAASHNPLALDMTLYAGDKALTVDRGSLAAAFPRPVSKLVLLIHGLCMNRRQWLRDGHDHGAALAADIGCASLYLDYNTGRRIADNGRELAELLERLVGSWPHPVGRVSIVGHSMGGLVARRACHHAGSARHAWLRRLDRLIFLGTPHLGAPAERAGRWIDALMSALPVAAPLARIGKLRSAGVRDLGRPHLRDDDRRGAGAGSLPLPAGVQCYAMAASLQARPAAPGASIRGDGLVPVASALARSRDPARDLGFPDARCRVVYGSGHFDLLGVRAYAQIERWMRDRPLTEATRSAGSRGTPRACVA